MNKVIVGIIALVVVSSGAFVLLGSDDGMTEDVVAANTQGSSQTEANVNEIIENKTQTESVDSKLANYVEYSEEQLQESSDTKRVVFFHAPWCSTCKFFEGQIEKQGVPADITIIKADYDTENDLKEKYGVTVQSTFVLLDESGNVLRTWPYASGLSGIEDLYSAVRET